MVPRTHAHALLMQRSTTPITSTSPARSSSPTTASGRVHPNPVGRRRASCATATCWARAGTQVSAARTPRSTRSPRAAARPGRRDDLRVARAVLSPGPARRRAPTRSWPPASAASSSPATTRPRRPTAAAWASCATRASRSTSPTASSPHRARLANQAFRKHARTGRPWVLFKSAMTLDGKVATPTGDSKWISRHESRERAHRWRASVDAVAVGIGTALADDPQLTARDRRRAPPAAPRRLRRDGRLPLTSKLVPRRPRCR